MRRRLRRLINRFGYDVRRIKPGEPGLRPELDVRHLLRMDAPMIFDVGANVGQSVELFKHEFPSCEIHAFEPSVDTFEVLKSRVGTCDNVHPWNVALGSTAGTLLLRDNEISEMTSFLPLGPSGWGKTKSTTPVQVQTVDDFCRREAIDRIDVLKSDTQGFEFEVFKGAESMLREARVGLIYCEVNLVEIYEGVPSPWQLIEFLNERDFDFVTFYPLRYRNGLAAWTDALFAHKSVLK